MDTANRRFMMLHHISGGLSLQQLAQKLGTTPQQAESSRRAFLASLEPIRICEPPDVAGAAPGHPDSSLYPLLPNATEWNPWGLAKVAAVLAILSGALGLLTLL